MIMQEAAPHLKPSMAGPASLLAAALPGVLTRRTVVGVAVLVWNTGSAALLGVWMPKPAKAPNTSLRLAASAAAAGTVKRVCGRVELSVTSSYNSTVRHSSACGICFMLQSVATKADGFQHTGSKPAYAIASANTQQASMHMPLLLQRKNTAEVQPPVF
jgi:hypothetical protein